MDGPTYPPTYRPTDTARCRVACPRLKISSQDMYRLCIKTTSNPAHSATDDDLDGDDDGNDDDNVER